jgi:tetratricopeptide (TPR) repeat protein/tRNA A-37 threonylcarbamoyl transferase component Bud32
MVKKPVNMILVLVIMATAIAAQDKKTEDLKKKISVKSGKEKAQALNELSSHYTYISAEEAITYGRQALELAKKLGEKQEEARALNNIGWGFRIQGKFGQAREFYEKGLTISRAIKNDNLIYNSLNNIGGTFEEDNSPAKALDYYRQTYELAKRIKWDKGISVSLNYMAIVFTNQNEYEKALKAQLEALAIQERIGNKLEIANTLHNMGHIYFYQEKYRKALGYYQRSLTMYKKKEDPRNTALALNSVGVAYICLKELDRAIAILKEALAMAEKIDFQSAVANAVGNLAIAYKEKGDFKNSLAYYQRELEIWQAMQNKYGLTKVYLNMGETYLKMKDYNQAESYMARSLTLAREIDSRDQVQMNLNNLSELFREKGEYKKALDYFREAVDEEKTIMNKETAAKMTELEAKYDSEKKKRQIDLLQKNVEIQKLQLSRARFRTGALVSGIGLLLVFFFLLFRRYLHLLAFWKKKNYISHYKLDRQIGSGAMGVVWQASDLTGAKRSVALKLIREEHASDPVQRKRFLNEAYLVDRLDHPNIIKVFERGEYQQTLFIAMELLDGDSLADVIRAGERLPVSECLGIMRQLADALACIHGQGILHRDVKPANVMLTSGAGAHRAKLLDFGLARSPSLTRLTETGEILGTVYYMAPELISQRQASAASDVYALGVVLYELLTLEKPFLGENPGEIIRAILENEPVSPAHFRPDLSAEQAALVLRMLSKAPEQRPADDDLLAAFAAAG